MTLTSLPFATMFTLDGSEIVAHGQYLDDRLIWDSFTILGRVEDVALDRVDLSLLERIEEAAEASIGAHDGSEDDYVLHYVSESGATGSVRFFGNRTDFTADFILNNPSLVVTRVVTDL